MDSKAKKYRVVCDECGYTNEYWSYIDESSDTWTCPECFETYRSPPISDGQEFPINSFEVNEEFIKSLIVDIYDTFREVFYTTSSPTNCFGGSSTDLKFLIKQNCKKINKLMRGMRIYPNFHTYSLALVVDIDTNPISRDCIEDFLDKNWKLIPDVFKCWCAYIEYRIPNRDWSLAVKPVKIDFPLYTNTNTESMDRSQLPIFIQYSDLE